MNKFLEQITTFFIALFELEYEHLLYDDAIYNQQNDSTAKL
ncbi:hypothetical protein [Alkalihalobacterium alkalinitrilicum]|nr:hypothetical protein [Alkalihalobacterium alkalinitrilicum]